jgi:hypothetical protein
MKRILLCVCIIAVDDDDIVAFLFNTSDLNLCDFAALENFETYN